MNTSTDTRKSTRAKSKAQLQYWFVCCVALLLPVFCAALEAPIPVEPVATNAPGPALEDSLVAFRWRAANEATGYQLIIRDLDTLEVEDHKFPATTLFSQVTLIAGHRYLWSITALIGTNSAVSATNYFTVAIKAVYPVITGVLPDPVPALDGAQALVINGKEFRRGCAFVLRDKSTGESFRNLKMAVRRNSQFVVTPNFTKAEGVWSVEVINPGGFSSSEFRFEVLSPARIARRQWRRNVFPWAAGVLSLVVAGTTIVWQRRRGIKAIAQAQKEASRREHERVSRDLHDSVNDLNQINLLAGTLKLMVEKNSPSAQVQATAGKISFAVVEAVNGIADMIWVGEQENHNLANLVVHLKSNIGRFREFNPDVNCQFDSPFDLPEHNVSAETTAHLLRITSEALRNILKHANATEVRCHLAIEEQCIRLTIEDNGCGFTPNDNEAGGRGVSNMRRRAEELGAEFTLQSAPDQGTAIRVVAPLR